MAVIEVIGHKFGEMDLGLLPLQPAVLIVLLLFFPLYYGTLLNMK